VAGADGSVLLLGSRLDTAWTALPAAPAFVPFVDALVNRLARGEHPSPRWKAPVCGVPDARRRYDRRDHLRARPRESDLTPASPALVREVLGADVLDGAAFMAAGLQEPGAAMVVACCWCWRW